MANQSGEVGLTKLILLAAVSPSLSLCNTYWVYDVVLLNTFGEAFLPCL
jgi:hypothetical protein